MKHALVVTSIAQSPTPALKALAEGAKEHQWPFYLIGDAKSPRDFRLPGSLYYDFDSAYHERTGRDPYGFEYVGPVNHYARKNLGYLLAMRDGADVIVETDDDNEPRSQRFWDSREHPSRWPLRSPARGWVNLASAFNLAVWPRGYPLTELYARRSTLELESMACRLSIPIHQGMVNGDPDVDAIFRMLLPPKFPLLIAEQSPEVLLESFQWCPINSQNTTWFKPAFPLLYLPSTCNSRCSDIWRGLIAQRIVWTVPEWGGVLFHGATVTQQRNPHDLLKDFEDEIPLYLYSGKVAAALEKLDLPSGIERIAGNLQRCYCALGEIGGILSAPEYEMDMLSSWLKDVSSILATRP